MKSFKELFIMEDTDLSKLDLEIQKQGEAFITNNHNANTIKNIFNNKIISKLEKPLPVYEGKGITVEDIETVLANFEKDQDDRAKKYFNAYKQKKNQSFTDQDINDWLDKIKQSHPHAHVRLMKKIKENE